MGVLLSRNFLHGRARFGPVRVLVLFLCVGFNEHSRKKKTLVRTTIVRNVYMYMWFNARVNNNISGTKMCIHFEEAHCMNVNVTSSSSLVVVNVHITSRSLLVIVRTP